MKLRVILVLVGLFFLKLPLMAQDFWLTYSSPSINLVIRDNYMSVVEIVNEYDVVLGSGLNGLTKHEVKKHLTIPDKKLVALKSTIKKSGFFSTPQKEYKTEEDEKKEYFTLFIAMKGQGHHVYRFVLFFNSQPPESFNIVKNAILELSMDAYTYE